MYCGDDEPRNGADFGSQGLLGRRHMADRSIESKAVHINQSATSIPALMGWGWGWGGGIWWAEAGSLFAADRRDANFLCLSAGVRLVLSVPEERTSLDLPGQPASSLRNGTYC